MSLHWECESAFDRGEKIPAAAPSPWHDLLTAFASRRWSAVYSSGEHCFASAETAEEQAFILQWLLAATEIEYDLAKRERYLSFWNKITDWHDSGYCRYLHAYQDGLTAFFQTYLREAELHFARALEEAKALGYARGRMRALFHLGLVKRDLGLQEQALEFYALANVEAQAAGASDYSQRISREQGIRDGKLPEASWGRLKLEIETLLCEGKFAAARELTIAAEVRRRREKLGRRRENLAVYFQILFAQAGKKRSASLLAAKLKDRLVRLHWLGLKARSVGTTEAEKKETAYLERALGLDRLVTAAPEGTLNVCGLALTEIKDQDVRKLIEILYRSEYPLAKEELVRKVWGLTYDPTMHDGRLYKLLHRARKIFGVRDLFHNHYGLYSLNRSGRRAA